MSSFHVDGRVTVKFDFDLATRLGDFILESGTADKQFLALGHKLQNLALEDEEDDFPRSERSERVRRVMSRVSTVNEDDVIAVDCG
jgi:hypothetical protein